MKTTNADPFLPNTTAPYSPCVVDHSNKPDHCYNLVVRKLTSQEELHEIKPQWTRLQREALYCNVAYGYTYLTTAIKHLASSEIVVLAVEKQFAEDLPPELVGIIPYQQKKVFKLPLKAVELWKHDHCFDTTPLLAKDVATEAWTSACQFLFDQEKVRLISLDTISAEPDIEATLNHTANELGMVHFQRSSFQRAALRPLETTEKYRSRYWSKNMRRERRKGERRLADRAAFRFEESSPESDFSDLAEEFIRLEHSGWKGEEGTSLKSNSTTSSFYRELIELSAQDGNARFVSLFLGGKRIAMLSDLRLGNTIYSYKSAYDNAYKELMPGKICEMKNVELLHGGEVDLADSCTASDNVMFNRIWGQKLNFQTVVFAPDLTVPRTVVKLLPVIQSLKQKMKPNS